MDDRFIWQIILQFCLIFINAVFACAEIAVISMNDNKLAKLTAAGDKKAMRLTRLTEQPSRFLSTIQVGITLAGFLGSAFAADNFSEVLTQALVDVGVKLPVSTLDTLSVILITIILSYFTLILGELVPKRIAMKKAEQLALAMSGLLLFISQLFAPIVWFLTVSTNGILRLFGIDPHAQDEEVTEEEIRMMVDVGQESGVIEQNEKVMINNVLEFDDTTAGEIMTHRTDMVAVPKDAAIDDIVSLSIKEGYSRIPVYGDDIDDIIGLLYIKDLLCFIVESKKEEFDASKFMRSVLYIPESMSCTDIFAMFKEKKVQMAIVVDEYGGTSGLVTMEDLLESIVGNIQDEYDNEVDEIFKVSDNVYTLDGSVSIDEIEELFSLNLDSQYSECDTLGGLITQILDRIPSPDEKPSVKIGNVQFTVLLVSERRIQRVKAEILKDEDKKTED